MFMKGNLLFLLPLIANIQASPFELTEAYIESFSQGLQELKKISEEYEYQEENFVAEMYDSKQSLTDAKEYDFIIIGSGPSGSVIANRLSEIPEWKVLLLEAGAPETKISQVPSMYHYLQTTHYDWRYSTVSQNHSCLGMEEHRCSIAAGKALGGNTAVNDMLYGRGNQRDYDLWADLGLPEWCWNDVLPYFKKIEDAHISDFDRKHHNLGGPLHLENYQHSTILGHTILQAGHELGIKTIDYNGKEQLGLAIPQAITKNGKRNSVAQAYLEPAKKRKNLEVVPLSRVIQILISPHTKEAYGVKFIHDGHLYVAKTTKEIILSAGAINTPQLLMLSGIGPKEELEQLHITPVADLRVGKNLKDQVGFIGLNFILNETSKVHGESEFLMEYLKNGKGPLTSAGIEAVGFLKTDASKEQAHYPDIELLISNNIYNRGHQIQKSLRVRKEIYDAVWAPLEPAEGFSIQVILLHPKSTGALTLHDSDPLHHPLINTNSLTDLDDRDVESLLAGIKLSLKLSHTDALQKLGIHLNHNKVPGCEHYEGDNYWKCAIKYLSVNLGQISGTAKMGPVTDKEAVVDEKLRVYGVHKLRVADASVIPVTISSNLMAPCIMIGEKAADLIKETWK
nr:glucose dehydrogenase [FAD, quinone]-like isoform X1 [Leptinotarsa decemlineata]